MKPSESKIWFFERSKKINNPVMKLMKGEKESKMLQDLE